MCVHLKIVSFGLDCCFLVVSFLDVIKNVFWPTLFPNLNHESYLVLSYICELCPDYSATLYTSQLQMALLSWRSLCT